MKKVVIFLSLCVVSHVVFKMLEEVYKENLSTAYGFLTKNAALKLQINISTILAMEGGHSYQIRWNEEIFTIGTGEKR